MYKIEQNDAGFKLIFSGTTSKEELERWLKESEIALKAVKGPSP
jgi:hypothetical protein